MRDRNEHERDRLEKNRSWWGEAFSRKTEREDRYEENIIGRETECDKNMKRGRKYESVRGEDKHYEYERKDEKKAKL